MIRFAVLAAIAARTAHHEEGHVVAVVLTGGELVGAWINDPDPFRDDAGGITRHRSRPENRRFVAYAGPWVEAMWNLRHESSYEHVEVANYPQEAAEMVYELMGIDDFGGGDDSGIYYGPGYRESDESEWHRELNFHLGVIEAVAALPLWGEVVTNQVVTLIR